MKTTHQKLSQGRLTPTRNWLAAVLLMLTPWPAHTADALAPAEIEQGFQSMYNLDFQMAHQDFSTWERIHPDDPMGPVSQAAGFLFGEFARLDILESQLFTDDKNFEARSKLIPDPKVREQFYAAVDRGDQLADAALKVHADDSNALFAKCLAMGLRSEARAHPCPTAPAAQARRLRCSPGGRRGKLPDRHQTGAGAVDVAVGRHQAGQGAGHSRTPANRRAW
jgi:hypothetical protein